VVDAPNAGSDTTVRVCPGVLVDLDLLRSQLGDTGGTFSTPNPISFSTSTVVEYTVATSFPCTPDISEITILVGDNEAPIVRCQPDTVYLNAAGSATAIPIELDNGSTDNCGAITFTLSQSNFTCADVDNVVPVVLTVADDAGNDAACNTTITVLDTIAPQANCAPATIFLNTTGVAQLHAATVYGSSSDNCLIADSTVSPNSFTAPGSYNVWLVLTDQSGNVDSCSTTVTVADTIAPVAICQDITVYLNASGSVVIASADIDAGSTDNNGIPTVLASDTTFDCSNIGSNPVTLTVTDSTGNTATCVSTVTVLDTIAPALSCQDIIVYLDATGSVAIIPEDLNNGTNDNCANPILSIDQSSFDCTDFGAPVTVTLTADDGVTTTTCTALVTVLDTIQPAIVCQNLDVYLNASGNATITPTDVDNGSIDNCGSPTLSLDRSIFSCADLGTPVSVILSATDGSGNVASCTSLITVHDTIRPVVSCQDIDVYLDASGNATLTATDLVNAASDNCSTPTLSINVSTFSCADLATPVNVTLTATDAVGNTNTCIATVTVLDTIGLQLACPIGPIEMLTDSFSCSVVANYSASAMLIDPDNCSGVSINVVGPDSGDVIGVGTHNVVIEFTEVNGNVSSCNFNIIVRDSIAPEILCVADVEVYAQAGACNTAVNFTEPTATDNCTGVINWTKSHTPGDLFPLGSTLVTYTATDQHGNSSDCLFIVTVLDSVPQFSYAANSYCSSGGAAIPNNVTPTAGYFFSSTAVVDSLSGQVDLTLSSTGSHTISYATIGACADTTSAIIIIVEQPNAGVSNSLDICTSDLTPVDLFTLLGNDAQVGGTWSINGVPATGFYAVGTDSSAVYTYTVASVGPCPADVATVTVSETIAPDAGSFIYSFYCDAAGPVILNTILGPHDGGGTWIGSGVDPVSGSYTPIDTGIFTFLYTVPGNGPCSSDTASVVLEVMAEADAGGDITIQLCSNSGPIDLFDSIPGNPQNPGSWSNPVSGSFNGTFNPLLHSGGEYTYIVNALAPCTADSSIITVAMETQPVAGNDTTVTICTSTGPVLFTSFISGSTSSNGGSWLDPFNNVVSSLTFDPNTDPSGLYQYVLQAASTVCANDTAFVTINVANQPDPGIGPSLPVQLCSSEPTVDLLSFLLGTPDIGGSWTDPSGTAHSGILIPAESNSGVYTHTVGGGNCPLSSALVNVSITDSANAGISASITLCQSGDSINLFSVLNGTPDASGKWFDDPLSPTLLANTNDFWFDPSVDAPGDFWYAVSGTPPCATAWASVTVNIPTTANAGTNGNITLCQDASSFPLFSILGGTPQPGGNWSFAGVPASATFDPASSVPGIYLYTVDLGPSCGIDSATVTISVINLPNAGISDSIRVCDTEIFTLTNRLGGIPDAVGAWVDPNGDAISPVFNGSINQGGLYTYTVPGIPPCGSSSATLHITIEQFLSAGLFADTLVCSSTTGTLLGHTGIFDPQVDGTGGYKYAHGSADNACSADTASVFVQLVQAPFADEQIVINRCASDGSFGLLDELTIPAPADGSWIAPMGNVYAEPFNPNADSSGTYLFVVDSTTVCDADTVLFQVTINSPYVAGGNDSLSLCESLSLVELDSLLTGASFGNGAFWTAPDQTELSSDTLLASAYVNGTYTYHTLANGSCPADSAKIHIVFSSSANAGNDAIANVCETSDSLNIISLIGIHDIGGQWFELNNSIWIPTSITHFDPQSTGPGAYEYKYVIASVAGGCDGDSALVSILVEPGNFGGVLGPDLEFCTSTPTEVNLFDGYSSVADSSGLWSDINTNPNGFPLPGGAVSTDTLQSGVYKYVYRVHSSQSCPAVVDTVTLIIYELVSAGIGGNDTTLCEDGPVENLFLLLDQFSDTISGTWLDPNSVPTSALFNPQTDPAGIYSYRIPSIGVCPPSSATVEIILAPSAGPEIIDTLTICDQTDPINLNLLLHANALAGGLWQVNGDSSSGIFVPGVDPVGTYKYTVLGCLGLATSEIHVIQGVPANPSWNAPDSPLCRTDTPIDLSTLVQGQSGGTWAGAGVNNGLFDPGALTQTFAIVTYTVGSEGCQSAESDTIFVVDAPNSNAGVDAETCGLSIELNAGPGTNGTWSATVTGISFDDQTDPQTTVSVPVFGTYQFVYSLSNGICTAHDTVAVTFFQPLDPSAVNAGPDQVLDIEPSTTMNALPLTQGNGLWSVLEGSATIDDITDPFTTVSGLQSGENELLWTVTNGPCLSVSDRVMITLNSLQIPTGFSPNGDLVNDVFEVTGINGHPNAELRVFDRWGVKVYESMQYRNEWDGRSMNGRELPDDTYFVVLQLEEGNTYTGYVIIKR